MPRLCECDPLTGQVIELREDVTTVGSVVHVPVPERRALKLEAFERLLIADTTIGAPPAVESCGNIALTSVLTISAPDQLVPCRVMKWMPRVESEKYAIAGVPPERNAIEELLPPSVVASSACQVGALRQQVLPQIEYPFEQLVATH